MDELVVQLRAEIGDSTNVAMGLDGAPALKQTLKRVQETYHLDFDWPHLDIKRDEVVPAGQRYFTFDPDVDPDRIFEAWVFASGRWEPLVPGISQEHYNSIDSEAGQTGTPARWQRYEDGQFELWPVPDTDTKVRFRCIRKLKPFSAGTDVCTLDSTLLVLHAAAELLARAKSEDASLKLTQATAHYNRLRGRSTKSAPFIMGGGLPGTPRGSRIVVPRVTN